MTEQWLYVESCVHYSNPQYVRQVLEPLKTHGISDGEMCVIANACPESVDEVFVFVPALKANKEVINNKPVWGVNSLVEDQDGSRIYFPIILD